MGVQTKTWTKQIGQVCTEQKELKKALNLLDTYDGQLSKTARALGINRYTLRSWRDKRKKVCTPLEVLSLYQTCRSNMVDQQGVEPWSTRDPTKTTTVQLVF